MTQPWLFGRAWDLLAFGGSFLLALLLTGLGAWAGALQEPLPLGLWLVLVVGVDVTHVHATWLRTYWDPGELRAHPWRYALVPVLAWAVGASLHAFGAMVFWRALAYLAVFHFIRQQVGWVALYQRLEPGLSSLDRNLDRAATYAATLWPLLWWHSHLPRNFSWFVAGDFAGPVAQGLARVTLPVYLSLLVAYLLRQGWRWGKEGAFPLGKSLVVLTTALSWWLGIVALDSDWAFTALNVLPHGVPYAILVWRRSAAEPKRAGLAGAILRGGPALFLLLIMALAFGEEWLWDLGIWNDHPEVFGDGWDLSPGLKALLVPLLALPQAAHYLLDGFIWRGNRER
jgi:hypothetical protein